MTTHILIRHGETIWNAEGRFQGHQNISLNEVGRAQAAVVARASARYHFEALYTSDLARASETAELVAAVHHLPVHRDQRLREADFGAWEGLALPEIAARWPELLAVWREDPTHIRPPDGETLAELQARVVDVLHDLQARHPAGQVGIVAHGGTIRAAIALALGTDMSLFRRVRLDNCSISIIRAEGEQYTLMHMNDICHLGDRAPRATWDESGDQWRLAFNGTDLGAEA